MKSVFVVVASLALLFNIGCEQKKEAEESEIKLLVTSPLEKDTIVTKEYVGQIRAVSHIELRTLEKGYLHKIFVDEGQFVRKGQLMFQIMPMILEAEQQKAKAEAGFAEIEYQNTKS